MQCLHKILIKKNPWSDPIKVPCGQCIACRLNRASDWATRIMHEKKMCGCACFVTLTYNDENVPRVIGHDGTEYGTLVKRDVQLFLKRLRKEIEPKKIRYYLCGEYGDKFGRPHYHVIIFGQSANRDFERLLQSVWPFGFISVGTVSFDSAAYVARYCTKLLTGPKKIWYEERNILPEFSLMSRRPGIGASWLEKYGNEVKTHHNVVVKGKKMAPPRYYRDKVYDEVDRSNISRDILNKVIEETKQMMVDLNRSLTLPEEREAARERKILAMFDLKRQCHGK